MAIAVPSTVEIRSPRWTSWRISWSPSSSASLRRRPTPQSCGSCCRGKRRGRGREQRRFARWKNGGKTGGNPWGIHVICGENRRLWRRSGENMVNRLVKLGRYCKNNWKMLRKTNFSDLWSWIVCCFVGWRMDEIWPCQLSSLLSSW